MCHGLRGKASFGAGCSRAIGAELPTLPAADEEEGRGAVGPPARQGLGATCSDGPAAWMLQEVFATTGLPGALCTACVGRDLTRPRPPWRSMQRWTVLQPSLNPAWLEMAQVLNGDARGRPDQRLMCLIVDQARNPPGASERGSPRDRDRMRQRLAFAALAHRHSNCGDSMTFTRKPGPSERIARTGADASRPLSGRHLARRLRTRGEARGRHYPITGVSDCVADPSFSRRRS